MRNTIFTALIFSSFNAFAGAPFLLVGDDNACNYDNIQEAIDSNISDTIRIASNKVYFEDISIDDIDLTLTGGYADCTNANNNITDLSQAIIDGGGSGSVISVSGNNQARDVVIRSLQLTNGDSGLMTTADAQLNVSNVLLINNNNVGAFLFGGDNFLTFDDVLITSNDGPGVVCVGENNTVQVEGDSLITQNDSPGTGGGMSITAGCRANLYAPVKIASNTAVTHGGGISVSNGALVNLNGIELIGNLADSDSNDEGDGGAIHVTDMLSIVNAVNVKFDSNNAYRGGAVATDDDGRFTSYAANSLANPCSTPGECTSYLNNSARELGGVFHAINDSQIKVLHANIKNNGLFGHGMIGHTAFDGSIDIEGSMIVKNGGEDLPGTSLFFVNGISGDNEAAINLNHVTIADNYLSESVIRNLFGTFSMNASIIQEEVDVSDAIAAVSHTFECAIVHETDSFSAGGTVIVEDPGFINPGSDFHIKPTSPAVDYCYAAEPLTVELGYDIDLEGRDYDDPNVDNLHGTYDVGADEYRWDNDLIFMNDFEQN